jgi:hypothetical protein
MYKKTINMIVFCMLSLGMASCASLKSKHYVGEKESGAEKDLKKETIWQFQEKVYYVRAIDPQTLIASTLEWNDEKKKYEVKTSQIVISKLNENLFLNLKPEKEDLYTILRLSPSTDKIMAIFTVDSDIIQKHMKEGRVKAVKKGDDFILELSKEQLDKYVQENINDLFNYKNAGIIKAIKGFKDKK